ncbi:uncharacterized protein VP01_2886g1 [Puccinia sorghi]|uniref:DDE Tnp4 domain-containing protein n=1 Tax=Puccinia sorghi TaxID=27349 RepID=A0A0L6V1M1_9BASI|nr:uncharacterized protein VP01_2886g1 [Puccinia sorghi]
MLQKAVEHIFGMFKRLFPILKNPLKYLLITENHILIALAVNYIYIYSDTLVNNFAMRNNKNKSTESEPEELEITDLVDLVTWREVITQKMCVDYKEYHSLQGQQI